MEQKTILKFVRTRVMADTLKYIVEENDKKLPFLFRLKCGKI